MMNINEALKSLETSWSREEVLVKIQNGENSGKLEEMLSKLSDYLETRFKNSTKIAMNLLEPLVIIILGVFVALIVLAILLPLIQLNTFSL